MKKRTKKKINSILAIFMSLAIFASGFGTLMAGLVAAAGENSAQQTEKTVEKTSVEKAPEQTGAKYETKNKIRGRQCGPDKTRFTKFFG